MSVAATPQLSHLRALESEAIHVMREVAAEFERPVLLFSGGKDSIVLLRLAEKAFRPAAFPFPLMHVCRRQGRVPPQKQTQHKQKRALQQCDTLYPHAKSLVSLTPLFHHKTFLEQNFPWKQSYSHR